MFKMFVEEGFKYGLDVKAMSHWATVVECEFCMQCNV
jgi:hypothetical protein